MKLISLILDEPSQIIKIIFNLLKIVLTVAISFDLFGIADVWSLDFTASLITQISAKEVIIGLLVICLIWFLIWEILLLGLFFLLRKVGKAKEFNKKLELEDLQQLFRTFKLYSETKGGYIKPSTKSTEIALAIDSMEEDFSLKNTFVSDFIIVCVVSWVYLLFNTCFSCSALIWFVVTAIIILLLVLILFLAEKLFTELGKNFLEIKNQLKSLVFKSNVHHVIVNYFKGGVNQDESNLIVNFNEQICNVFDHFSYLKELGEINLKDKIKNANLSKNSIIIVNFQVSNDYQNELEKEKIFIVSGDSEEEMIIGIAQLIDKGQI